MARKDARDTGHARGFSDIIGIVLIALALLLLVAELSFDRLDVAANRLPPNEPIHNWIGTFGAWSANGFFKLFGVAAFVLPLLMFVFGLSYLFEFFGYLKRRWTWAAVLFVCCVGLLDLYTSRGLLDKLAKNPKLPNAALLE